MKIKKTLNDGTILFNLLMQSKIFEKYWSESRLIGPKLTYIETKRKPSFVIGTRFNSSF